MTCYHPAEKVVLVDTLDGTIVGAICTACDERLETDHESVVEAQTMARVRRAWADALEGF